MARKNLKVVSRVIPSFLRPPNSFTFSLSGFPVLALKNSNVDFVIVVVPKISRFLAFGFFGFYYPFMSSKLVSNWSTREDFNLCPSF